MRRIFCLLTAICCMLGLIGCSAQNAAPEDSIAVYYRKATPVYGTDDGMIASGRMDLTNHTGDYVYLLEQYLRSSPGEEFADTFPDGTSVINFQLEALTAKVVLNSRITQLSGMDLTIALTCLTRTVMDLTGCHEVILSARGALLNGENFITLNQDSFLLIDHSGTAQN